jgi:hypothetical protein
MLYSLVTEKRRKVNDQAVIVNYNSFSFFESY